MMGSRRQATGQLKQLSKEKKSWTFVATVGYDEKGDQKQRRFTVYGNRKEAETRKAEILAQIQQGTYVDATKVTLQEFAAQWLSVHGETKITAATKERYESDLKSYVYPHIGAMRLNQIGAEHLEKLYAKLLKEGRRRDKKPLATSTLLCVHKLLHKIFAVAVRWRYIAANPVDLAERPAHVRRESEVYDADQARLLLAKAEGTVFHVPVAFSLLTGMRRGEVLALRWQDLNLEKRTVTVRRAMEQTKEHGVRPKLPKNNRTRLLALPQTLVGILEEHRRKQQQAREQQGLPWRESDLVVPGDSGGPWKPNCYTTMFIQFMKRSGLTRIKFHGLRHTHATLLLDANIHPEIASEQMGHSGIGITMDLYSHARILTERKREIADKMDEIF
jgi:integrase